MVYRTEIMHWHNVVKCLRSIVRNAESSKCANEPSCPSRLHDDTPTVRDPTTAELSLELHSET